MDTGELKIEYVSLADIWERAEDFRSSYIKNEDLPVDIEFLINTVFDIEIIPLPNLQNDCDMVGFISLDFKYIYVDEDLYMSDNHICRVRFTIAHEMGHYFMHRDKIVSFNFKTEQSWLDFRMEIKQEVNGRFEFQANEFGGRVLVPRSHLIKYSQQAKKEILKGLSWKDNFNADELLSLIASRICVYFEVSNEVIEKRLNNEPIRTILDLN